MYNSGAIWRIRVIISNDARQWEKLGQSFLDKSIGEWRRLLDVVVQQNGGHIEHMFK